MLTQEENEMLTRVGPGTPAGELLRRYWHPVAIAAELPEDNPVKFVRIPVRIAVRLCLMAAWTNEALRAPIMAGSTIFTAIVSKSRASRRIALFAGV
jgi:hypothetical protein